jgi:hypothetical protein
MHTGSLHNYGNILCLVPLSTIFNMYVVSVRFIDGRKRGAVENFRPPT